jgi:GT2 family glycosyltransferase
MTSILIINWNGTRFIFNCLDTILAHVTVPYEVIVVDNHSTDGSPEVLAERYPWVKLIRSDDNLGFTGGNNLAASHATGKYLLLLNYDTLLQTDIADAVKALDADDHIGAVGAMMYDGEGKLLPAAGHFPTPARLWVFSTQWDTADRPWPSPTGVPLHRRDRVDGSFLLTRTDSWRKIGGLDTGIYMYGEDVSYCRSLFEIGQVSVQCASIRYTHFVGYSHARMPYLFSCFRRYHRKFSSRRVQIEADLVLRVGLLLRIPWYWVRSLIKKDEQSRIALEKALEITQNWSDTAIEGRRYH